MSAACNVPEIKVLPKLHKATIDKGDSKTWPVVGASSCLNSRAGNLVADVLETVMNAEGRDSEYYSTEEVANKLDTASEKILKGQQEGRKSNVTAELGKQM